TLRRAVVVVLLAALDAFAVDVRFLREGQLVKVVDVAMLVRSCAPRTVEVDDPNYGARKRYRACALADVLGFGLGAPPATLGAADIFIRAWDGYDKPTTAARLAEPGAWLAFGDADVSTDDAFRWAPLGPKRIDPGPLYLVWEKPVQRDLAAYPWVWQVAEFEVEDFAHKYPHVM